MKNLKKVLAFVVVFAMMLTSAVSAASFPDVADDASYAEAATILSSLGLMIGDDMGNFNPDKILTRAEATALIMRAKGLESASAGAAGATQFTDVAADHWASGYINLAAQSNVVAGYGDGTFGPENEVKYEEFVKMVVAALGYTPKANTLGGYPSGYLIIASQENITKGAAGAAGQPAPRSTVAQLLFNSLDVFIMEQTVFVEGEERFEPSETKTLLNTYLGVNKYEGYVTEVNQVPVASDEETTIDIDVVKVDKKAVEKASTTYDINDLVIGECANAATLLGYYVTAYVGEDEITGGDVLKAIAPKTGKNEVVTVDYSQITDFTPATGATESADVEIIYYLENETDRAEKELEVSAAAWYFNGDADTTDYALSFLEEGTPGVITFLSNDGTEGYEYAFVKAYGANYLVGEVDAENNILIDKDNNPIDIDIEDENVVYTFIKDGVVVSYDDIKAGDVLTLAESVLGDLVTVYVSDAVVEGTVTEIGSADGEATYAIGGEEYKAVSSSVTGLKMGAEGKFYLNVDGRIAFAEAISSASDNYAYLLDADVTAGLGGDVIEVKFINAAGEWSIAEFASKVTVNDGDAIDVTASSADFGIITKSGESVTIDEDNRFFTFELNSAGKIRKIYTAVDGYDVDRFSLDADGSAEWKASTNRLGNIYLTENTKIFYVDQNLTAENEADRIPKEEKDIQVGTISSLIDGEEYDSVMFYDRDSEMYAGAVVILNSNPGISDAMHPMVLTKVSTGTNDAGAKVIKLYGYQNGEAVTAECNEDVASVSAVAGDVILFNVDAEGKVDEISVIMTAAEAKEATIDDAYYAFDAANGDKEVLHHFGLVEKKSGNIVTLKGADDVLLKGSNLNFYVVNVNRDTAVVSTGSYNDITAEPTRTGNKVATVLFVREFEGEPVIAVAYQMTYSEAVKEAWAPITIDAKYFADAEDATEYYGTDCADLTMGIKASKALNAVKHFVVIENEDGHKWGIKFTPAGSKTGAIWTFTAGSGATFDAYSEGELSAAYGAPAAGEYTVTLYECIDNSAVFADYTDATPVAVDTVTIAE